MLLSGCQSTNVAPLTRPDVPLESDERELLAQVRGQEQLLLRGGFVAPAPEIDAYLDGIVGRLYPPALPDGFRLHVRVIADPAMNAFAMPNGAMFVHTGLLARVENEAQLAAVLAHELIHAVHRHGLKSYRSLKNHTALANTLYVGGGGSVLTLLTSLGAMSSALGYSRDLEREADEAGFRLLVAAGYDPREAAQVFRLLMEESARTKRPEPFFFSSHPRLAERSANFRELIDRLAAERRERGHVGAAELAAMLPPVLRLNAQAALQKGDWEVARESATRATRLRPDDARAVCLIAETYRRQPGEANRAAARRHYRDALALDPALPDAHRGIGLEAMKSGAREEAAAAFRRYLELAPHAEDRAHIEEFIRQCENKS